MDALKVGSWVATIDRAAFPGIRGQITELADTHHFETGEVTCTYAHVKWQGRGPKPPEWFNLDHLVPVEAGRVLPVDVPLFELEDTP